MIWSDKPAESWENEAFPIGNGRLGAMIFGETDRERIQFNEETLYSGKPSAHEGNPGAGLENIRKLLKEHRYAEAEEYTNQVFLKKGAYGVQSDFGLYQNMGEVQIEYCTHREPVTDYRRQLDLEEAVAAVSYRSGDIWYQREYLSSYPGNVIGIRLTADHKQAVSLKISLIPGQDGGVAAVDEDTVTLSGTTGYLGYEAKLKVICEHGVCSKEGEKLCVDRADSVTLLLTAATEYDYSSPDYRGNDYLNFNRQVLDRASGRSWDAIREAHIKDYRTLYSRVELKLGSGDEDNRPTAERLAAYREQADPALEALLFQYGRYLLISSSRQGTLPANLQGIWNDSNDPRWGSIFCYNINLNMNYWPAQITNLAECHTPLIQLIERLSESGKKAAKDYFHARGWYAGKKSDIWGYAQPYAEAVYGLFLGGTGWLCQDVWEYYSFHQDNAYLEKTAYPIMKEAAEFYLDYLTENEDQFLVSCPSTSPENVYCVDGTTVAVSDGCEMDHRIIEELFDNCIRCCNILGTDEAFKKQLEDKKQKIAPTKIGKNGEIQEWYQDWESPEKDHRHLSHMYGYFPGQKYTPDQNPELLEAARKTMDTRGDGQTGWSRAWKINLWARLLDGNRAYHVLSDMVKTRINSNLFAMHPPFQIDGNLGFTAGIAEMLIQSTCDHEIKLLPALPAAWEQGEVKGLRARGDFTVDMRWRQGTLESAVIYGEPGSSGRIGYAGGVKEFRIGTDGSCRYPGTDV